VLWGRKDKMSLDNKLEFDEEGFHSFVDSGHVSEAESYSFVSSAYVSKDDFQDRILYVEFRDGYLADFRSEEIAEIVDERLQEVEGIKHVYWEDRELFNLTYQEGQSIPDLIRRIDAKMIELSNMEEE
jgi:hypothetical protein